MVAGLREAGMGKLANISLKINDSLKREAEEILKTLGLTASHAIRNFYSRGHCGMFWNGMNCIKKS